MSTNDIRCPHGIVCDYIHRFVSIGGERYVVGGDYWHDSTHRCTAITGSKRS